MTSVSSAGIRAISAFLIPALCVGLHPARAAQSILPPQPEPFLAFGSAIAVDSDVAVIGAPGSEQLGPLTGSAFVARRDAGGNWGLEAELEASPSFALGQFGFSVAIDGSTAVVGAPFVGFDGFAYVFRQGPRGQWVQEAALTQPDVPFPVLRFGLVTAVQGDEAFIASAVDEIQEMAVFVYRRTPAATWELSQVLQPAHDISVGTGSSIAVDGPRLVIGNVFSAAGTQDFENLANAGAAYVFEKDASDRWRQTATLAASDAAPLDFFGSVVALEGDTAVVGAVGKQVGSVALAGAIYTFQRTPSGEWGEVDILVDPKAEPLAQMGHHVDVRAGRLAVRQWKDVNGLNTGQVQVFRRSGSGWALQDGLVAAPASPNDFFGLSAALADDQLLYHVNTVHDVGRVDISPLTPARAGDMNCDGLVDALDIALFVPIVLAPEPSLPACNSSAADVNADGTIDGRDIQGLVDAVLGEGLPPSKPRTAARRPSNASP